MAMIFISDLHLVEGQSERTRRFIRFLEELPESCEILVLGGDIFDLFVGDKAFFLKEYAKVLYAIEETSSRGVKVYYLQGNHDFHLQNVFSASSKVEVRDDFFEVQLGDSVIYIEHGDQINRRDYGYLFLRWFTRSWLFHIVLSLTPGSLVERIGKWSSKKSRKYTSVERSNSEQVAVTKKLFQKYAQKILESGSDVVLLGHSHIADYQEYFEEGGGGGRGLYVNLGFSLNSIPYLQIEATGSNDLACERLEFL